jgi:hypothetical protein
VHTVIVIVIGLVLLALALLLGRAVGDTAGMARAALLFVPLWLLAAGVNMYRGVRIAGYSIAEETPVLLLVFALPALVALLLWWRWR